MQREYFYSIDAEGRLFHDGSELTDPAFLDFFFARLIPNNGPAYSEYAFLSPCAGEKNYVSCRDTAVVFRTFIHSDNDAYLLYAGTACTVFIPEQLRIGKNGQLYHPVREGIMGRLGRHALIEISQFISVKNTESKNEQYDLEWQGFNYSLQPCSLIKEKAGHMADPV